MPRQPRTVPAAASCLADTHTLGARNSTVRLLPGRPHASKAHLPRKQLAARPYSAELTHMGNARRGPKPMRVTAKGRPHTHAHAKVPLVVLVVVVREGPYSGAAQVLHGGRRHGTVVSVRGQGVVPKLQPDVFWAALAHANGAHVAHVTHGSGGLAGMGRHEHGSPGAMAVQQLSHGI